MEVWKSVVGYEGLYEVSSFGAVKSLDRTIKYSNGGVRIFLGKILNAGLRRRGYLYVELNKGSKGVKFSIHRLVAETFIPNPENKSQVNHINGIKTDNRVENLEWVTGSENIRHAFKNGLKSGVRGENRSDSKLTNDQAREIKYGNKNKTYAEIGEEYGVSLYTVSKIRNGNIWAWL